MSTMLDYFWGNLLGSLLIYLLAEWNSYDKKQPLTAAYLKGMFFRLIFLIGFGLISNFSTWSLYDIFIHTALGPVTGNLLSFWFGFSWVSLCYLIVPKVEPLKLLLAYHNTDTSMSNDEAKNEEVIKKIIQELQKNKTNAKKPNDPGIHIFP